MLQIINIGMSHETAPVELRECLARDPDNVAVVLDFIRGEPHIREGLFLSTCNRVEALYTTDDPEGTTRAVCALMARMGNISDEQLKDSLYRLKDRKAVRHIFRVASSLDSMVVGEPQILGQIKEAYYHATKAKTSGVILNRLMHRAFHVAKRVRSETGVADAAVSISYAATELARKIFYDLSDKRVFLIGAGEMAELAAKHLLRQRVSGFYVANRTFNRAVEIAETFRGTAVDFQEIEIRLLDADIVITSTGSADYVIFHDMVKNSMRARKNRPLFFIDIAVPRDVEPRVNDLGNVYVYDIDDLKGVIKLNLAQRQREAAKAEKIVAQEVIRFEKWLQTLNVVPTIVSLKEKAEAIRQGEIRKSIPQLGNLSPMQMEIIERLTLSIVKKIMHDPILTLKGKAHRESLNVYLDMARKLFKLDQYNNDHEGE